MITRKVTRVIGTQDYINAETGEVISMEVRELQERDFNFTKVWMKDFAKIISSLSSASQVKFFAWIITHMNRENQITMTVAQMAEAVEISRLTATLAMKTLKAMNFIRKVGTVYMVNPEIIFRGTIKARMTALSKYNS